jgi:hypothetical protein
MEMDQNKARPNPSDDIINDIKVLLMTIEAGSIEEAGCGHEDSSHNMYTDVVCLG